MNVYDPYVHCECLLEETTALLFAGDYVPVKSKCEGKWFAVHFKTNRSFKLSELPEDADSEVLESMILAHELSDELLEACYEVRFRMVEVVPPSEAELDEAKARIDSRFGPSPPRAAEARATFSGYTPDEVRLATVRLSEKLLDDTLESIERIKISDLVEEG